MSSHEVVVRLDHNLLETLDRLAAEEGLSRSALLLRILTEYAEDIDWAEADEQLVAAYRAMPQDPAEIDAMMKVALENLPEW